MHPNPTVQFVCCASVSCVQLDFGTLVPAVTLDLLLQTEDHDDTDMLVQIGRHNSL